MMVMKQIRHFIANNNKYEIPNSFDCIQQLQPKHYNKPY